MRNDDTRKLVDEGWDKAWGFRRETRSWAEESAARTWFDHGVRIALEAAQRPPVSPEQREEIRAVVDEQLTKAGLNLNGPPYSDDGETQWPVALQLRDCLTNAILARFSLPSQPVYDEEKIALWLMREFGVSNGTQAWMEFQGSASSLAATIVAALPGLTKEETP